LKSDAVPSLITICKRCNIKKSDSPPCESKQALPVPSESFDNGKIVKIKTPGKKTASTTLRKASRKKSIANRKITDELLLDTVRDDVFKKLKTGDFNLSLNDGFKAIDLKNKITSPEPDNRLAALLEELRKELLK